MYMFFIYLFPFYGIEGCTLAIFLESQLYWRLFVCGERAKHKTE